MKIAAIIAEYNPLHNGHCYHLAETKRLTGADYVLVIMSGSFVQRGAPALCNKYIRTKTALLNGADAVLELPSLYALSSAEFFAQGAVTLLNQLGVIDFLSFGSESGELSSLVSLSQDLLTESAHFKEALSAALKSGRSFPAARADALKDIPNSPNDILAVEYCKALLASKSAIKPFTIKRKGAGYHSDSLTSHTEEFSSASAIRRAVLTKGLLPKEQLPKSAEALLLENHVLSAPMDTDDFSSLLHYRLLSEKEQGFSQYLDCSQSLSDKICKFLPEYRGFTDFCMSLKSKDITYTRCQRTLMHILLNITWQESYRAPFSQRKLLLPYGRLLGFRRDAAPLLSAVKKHSSIPLISKPADAEKLLAPKELSLLKQDIFCSDIYEAVHFAKTKETPLNEYRQSPIIL